MKYGYMYVLDGMADWEPGLAIAELNTGRFFKHKGERLPVKTFALDRTPVTTMGGQKITPDLAIVDIKPVDAALLLLPGGNLWQEARHEAALRTASVFLQAGVLVAAICGATEAMAQAGMLDNRPYTSNSLDYLKMAFPNYKGETNFKHEPVVVDKNLITAASTAAVDFAYHILDELDVFSDRTLEAWHQLFQTHDPRHILEIMESLPQN
ncbi:MAG TPA: type 1 glutamine amidotransferase family protein [Anaerolineales bacterium]|nr:type 1 glutamine amidotransferase family protein [Anaerolineales bacterium]